MLLLENPGIPALPPFELPEIKLPDSALPEIPVPQEAYDFVPREFWNLVPAVFFILVAAICFVIIFFAYRAFRQHRGGKNAYPEALKKRKILLRELDLLERNYLKRVVSKEEFEKEFKKKQAELIRYEAIIQNRFHKNSKKDNEYLAQLPKKKWHVATELLAQRKDIINEMNIAKQKFLKMQIDSPTYQQLTEKLQVQLIEVRAKLHELKTEDNVKRILKELKEKLREIEADEKMKKSEREKKVVEEVVTHLEEMHYLR